MPARYGRGGLPEPIVDPNAPSLAEPSTLELGMDGILTAFGAAGARWVWNAPKVTVTIVKGNLAKPIHAGWSVAGGKWMHAQGQFGRMVPRVMQGGPGLIKIPFPIRNVAAAEAAAAAGEYERFYNCITAAVSVIRAGW
jgi:hypothetical protein